MLKKQMTKYISDVMKTVEDDHSVHIELYKEEKEYAEKTDWFPLISL